MVPLRQYLLFLRVWRLWMAFELAGFLLLTKEAFESSLLEKERERLMFLMSLLVHQLLARSLQHPCLQ